MSTIGEASHRSPILDNENSHFEGKEASRKFAAAIAIMDKQSIDLVVELVFFVYVGLPSPDVGSRPVHQPHW